MLSGAHLQAAQGDPQPKLAKEPFLAHTPTEITIFMNSILTIDKWLIKFHFPD
jgi:hypothetical protein